MNNWQKGLLGALAFFIAVGAYVALIEPVDALEAGESFGSIIVPLILMILCIDFGYRFYNKNGDKNE